MKYDIALKFEKAYIDKLNSISDKMESVHFSLGLEFGLDARKECKFDLAKIEKSLKRLDPSIKRYVTLNGRFISPDKFSERYLIGLSNLLVGWAKLGLLDGILFLDFYFIKALCKANSEITEHLTLIPSINCEIDSIEKLNQYMSHLDAIKAGLVPEKIILDRSLNRKLGKLGDLCSYVRDRYPEMKVELLANEGCLLHCPFKVNHDINISCSSNTSEEWLMYSSLMSSKYGDIDSDNLNESCLQIWADHPEDIIKTPFIRPEDQDRYSGMADIIKISGKMIDTQILLKILHQYINKKSITNLIEILDAPSSLKDTYYLKGFDFPVDFIEKVGNCDKDCLSCSYCNKISDEFCIKYSDEE